MRGLSHRIVPGKTLPSEGGGQPMEQQARRSDEVAHQDRMGREDPPPQTVEPNPPPHEEIPRQDVTPFLAYEVGVLP